MEHIIRNNINQYMADLKRWLWETREEGLEEMGSFFSDRLSSYEEHMSIWRESYLKFAEFLPKDSKYVLDLGCGTGLELDEIFKVRPGLFVTGVDLCPDMLHRLEQKHPGMSLKTVCQDYFEYDMGIKAWDCVLSFESLHHFFPDKKKELYQHIYCGLKDKGMFLLGDYIACCEEEEQLLQQVYLEKREKSSIPKNQFVHFDIPLTLDHETALFYAAGFSRVSVLGSLEGVTFICGEK